MIELTEEQKLAIIREHRNAKMREWYRKKKERECKEVTADEQR